jgi:uncharacterized membrane protein
MRPQRWVRDNFIAGLAIVLPVALSIFLFTWGLEKITGGLSDFITRKWLGVDSGQEGGLSDAAKFSIKVAVLVIIIVATIMIGWLTRTIIGRHLIKLGDMILERIPLFNRIYIVLRQISQSMLNEKSDMFSAVVLVEFPRSGLQSVGFITGRFKGEPEEETKSDVYTVFVPTTPNPTTGFMLVATEDQFERLNLTIEEGMKMVISGGVVLPEAHKFLPERERFLAALSRGSSKGKS